MSNPSHRLLFLDPGEFDGWHRNGVGLWCAPYFRDAALSEFALVESAWVLTTPRLIVRPIQVAEADFYHRVRGMMPYDPQNRSLDESRALVASMVTRPSVDAEGWGQFAIIERASRAYVGDLGVNFDTPRARQAELGFAVDPAWRRGGIATEACGAMVEALFASGRTRVTALTDARNVPTQKLLEKLGFRLEGRYVRSWQDGDQWFDELAYARLADE